MIEKLKSNLLTYLFKDWVNNEYDLETLSLTRSMISKRETDLKYSIDKTNIKPILGFRQHSKKDEK
jgi:hypothetical protein|tara:strand:+ start:37 stop:234 length:198 start_codon:yes stop_codon:yes gene_type:complete